MINYLFSNTSIFIKKIKIFSTKNLMAHLCPTTHKFQFGYFIKIFNWMSISNVHDSNDFLLILYSCDFKYVASI